MTDETLYSGIHGNAPAALRYVYREFFPPTERYVLRNGGTAVEALDVFQESVVALYLNVREGKYAPRADSHLSTYFYAISKNIWRSQRRRRARLSTVPLEAALTEEGPPKTDEAPAERIAELEAAFDTLGDRCRRLLRLFYYERLPLKKIAALMTLTEASAKNSKYRCMRELREILKPDDH